MGQKAYPHRGEFAEPPVQITTASQFVIQCGGEVIGCKCGAGDPSISNPAVSPNAYFDESQLLADLKPSGTHAILTGSVQLKFEPKLRDPAEVSPTLEVSFTGREHLDLTTTTNVTKALAASNGPQTTTIFLKLIQRQPWKQRNSETISYDFAFCVPLNIPPSATPDHGTIDYRIEARFQLPEKEEGGYDELVSQKRIEVVRAHFSPDMAIGPPVEQILILQPLSDEKRDRVFRVRLISPEFAFLDSGKIDVIVFLASLNPESVNLIHNVKSLVVGIEERRRYIWFGINADGQKVRRSRVEIQEIGSQVFTDVKQIQTRQAVVGVKFGNGVAGVGSSGGIPIILHPTFSGGQIFVTHHIVVRVLYGDNPVDAAKSSVGLRGMFTKLTVNVGASGILNHEESVEVPIVLRTGVFS
ncbi:hypothetical protein HK100_009961 [Physocladia obscura]|uniref:Arrestin-like N-terminal domain-containing protein n=1 Tax=Physocladia obscura TaxID=109957 RepID=A0AAD5XJ28_9FUNG|nr:hypothetical protein HK100_009961 [Physocladia obscura]